MTSGGKSVEAIRVLVVDPSPAVRRGLRFVLEEVGDFPLQASDAPPDEAQAAVVDLRPHVVLVDLERAAGADAAAVSELKATMPGLRVAVLTASTDPTTLVRAVMHGADAVLHRDASPPSIAFAVRLLGEGDTFVVSHHLWPAVTAALSQSVSARSALDRLTARERETLSLLLDGRSDHEIAQALYISVRTANQHVSHILRKLGVRNRREAARLAAECGWRPAARPAGAGLPPAAGRATAAAVAGSRSAG
jgi:DNA-binding NarL/FixJ family response regulator